MRIKLDLSEFLEDERKFSVLKVKPKETKTVRDVISKISHLFSVYGGEEEKGEEDDGRPRLGLFDEEFYIHPDETSAVLEDSGVLKLKSLPRPGTKGKKKKKSKKALVPLVKVEDFEERQEKALRGDNEAEKKGTVQLEGKKKEKKGGQVSSKEVEPVPQEQEEPKKSSKKRKRCQFAEDVEELQGRKKSKMVEWEASVESREGEQVEEKKKRKKDKANREISIVYTSMEEMKGKKQQHQLSKHSHDSAGSHRKNQQRVPPVEEEWESPEPHLVERKKRKLKEDKGGGSSSSSSSQEKVVSTSSFLTTLDGSTSSSSSDLEVDDRRPPAADSVMDRGAQEEQEGKEAPTKRKRRRRRHGKKDAQRQPDPSTTDQHSTSKSGMNLQSSRGRLAQWERMAPANAPRTHVIFNSDDEEMSVTDQMPHQSKRTQSPQSATQSQNNQALATPRPAITGRVRNISRERGLPMAPPSTSIRGVRKGRLSSPLVQDIDMEIGEVMQPERHTPPYPEAGRGLVRKRPAHNNMEELATLRKICESNTITICKVDAHREEPKPKVETRPPPLPSPSLPPRRSPPSPPRSSPQGMHDNRRSGTLQNLMAMKNRTTPEVFSGVRAAGVRPIRRRTGASIPSRPPLTNGSSEPPTRTTVNLEPGARAGNVEPAAKTATTSLPDDDPLQILSSTLSKIRTMYNQDCQQTNVRQQRPGAMNNSLGALLAGMRSRYEEGTKDASSASQGKEKTRTPPAAAAGKKVDGGNEGATDLLVLECEDVDGSVSVPSKKKEGTPDIYCVSPSNSPVPQQQQQQPQTNKTTPQHEVNQPRPSQQQVSPFKQPQQQVSPSQPPQQEQISLSRLQERLTSSRPQASPSRLSPQTSITRSAPQASPLRPLQEQPSSSRSLHPFMAAGHEISQAMSLRQPNPAMLQASPGISACQTSPGMAAHHPRPSGPYQQASPFRPMQQSPQLRPMQHSISPMSIRPVRPQGLAATPSSSKWADDDIVDLESEDQLEEVTCAASANSKTSSPITPAAPPPPPPPPLAAAAATEPEKLTERTPGRGKEQDGIVVMDYMENRRGNGTPPSDLGTPDKPSAAPTRPVEGGMSTGQYIAEILEDCEMVGLSGSGVKTSAAGTRTREMPGSMHQPEIVDEEEEDEVVLDEDEVMIEEEEEEEEGEGEEEEVEGEEVEGEEEEGEEEEEEEEEYEEEEVEGEMMEEEEGEVEMVEEEEGEAEMVEEEEGEAEMVVEEEEEEEDVVEEVQEEEDDEAGIYDNLDDDEEQEEIDDQEHSDVDYEIIEESDTERDTPKPLAPEDATDTSPVANSHRTPSGNSTAAFPSQKESGKDTEDSNPRLLNDKGDITPITIPSRTPLTSKAQEAAPSLTTPLEVTEITTKSPKATGAITKHQEAMLRKAATLQDDAADMEVLEEVTPIIEQPQEVLPAVPKSLAVTPVKPQLAEISLIKPKLPEVTPVKAKPVEVTPVKPRSPETERLKSRALEITPVKSKPPESAPAKPKSPEVEAVQSKAPHVSPVKAKASVVEPVKPESPDIIPVKEDPQEATTTTTTTTTATSSASQPKGAAATSSSCKPKEDSRKQGGSKGSEPSTSATRDSTSPSAAAASSTTTATTSAATSSPGKDSESLNEAKNMLIQALKEDMVKDLKSAKESQDEVSPDLYSTLPLMTSPPSAGDYIALKTVVLDDCYSLSLSEYRVARVVAVEGIVIKLKFEDLSTAKSLDGEVKAIDWRDVLEPKLIIKKLQS